MAESESRDVPAAVAREQRALRISIAVSCGFAVLALVWGLVTRSQVMLLDAIFTPLSLLSTWGALSVSKLVSKGPTRLFPFGRDALIPLFVIVQALTLLGVLVYAAVEAVRVMLTGGSDVSGIALLAYGIVGGVIGAATWGVLRSMSQNQPLIDAEAAGWLSSTLSSVVIVLGAVVVLLIDGTDLAGLAPYADSVLVIGSSLALLGVPIGLVRRSVRELQVPSPDAKVRARVDDVVARVREREGLPEPLMRVGSQGHTLDVELAFVLPHGTGDIATEDRVRRGVTEGLAELPYDLWLSVEFTHDPDLVA